MAQCMHLPRVSPFSLRKSRSRAPHAPHMNDRANAQSMMVSLLVAESAVSCHVNELTFFFASIISYKNYKEKKERRFLKLYFWVMFISFISWTANYIFVNFFGWRLRWLANVYALNVIVFLVFLYGVIKVTKRDK